MTNLKVSMTSGSEQTLRLGHEIGEYSSRPNGVTAREMILGALASDDAVVIDFADANVSPSFADEAIGVLAAELGMRAFNEKVRMRNVPPSSQNLIRLVIRDRVAERRKTASEAAS